MTNTYTPVVGKSRMTTCVLEAVWMYKKDLCGNTHCVGFLLFFLTLKVSVPVLLPY